VKSEPDWERLRDVNAELEKLAKEGALTAAEWERLYAEAREAVGEHTRFLQSTIMLGIAAGLVTSLD
jgi:ribosomal protein L19E